MNLQSTSQEIYEKKYQLKDINGKLIDITLDDTFKRVARGLAELEIKYDNYTGEEPKSDKSKIGYWEEKFLWALNNGAIPAGRIIANAGTGEHKARTSTINCLVSDYIRDSIDSIGQGVHEAMVSLSRGAGMGFCFSLLRPKGAYVNGVGASTSGPLTFADIYDAQCKTISSAGGRRGAMMLTFHCHHPDVIDVIKAKREDGRLRQFNISILITEDFMEAVKSDSDWDLYFPLNKNEELPQTAISAPWPVTDDNYRVDCDGEVLCKVYKTIKARELFDLIMQSTYDFSEPGFILIDKINRENNNYFCEDIVATNPCFHPDTIVETVDGPVKIKDIKSETHVYSMGNNQELVIKKASASWISKKDAKTIKIQVNTGSELIVTPDHKIYVKDIGYKEAKDLKFGDNLVHLCRSRRGACYSGIKLTTEHNRAYRMEHRFIFEGVHGPLNDYDDIHHIDGDTYNNSIDNLELINHSEHASLTRHQCDNDHQVQCQKTGRFKSGTNSKKGKKTIIPVPSHLRTNLKNQHVKVTTIKEGPTTNVYDIQVEDTNNLITNFLVSHNCGEQPLNANGACLLGSINLTRFVINPFGIWFPTKDKQTIEYVTPRFDWDKFKKVVRILTRMLDNVVEIHGLPLEKQIEELTRKRRHGLGFLGLGSALIMMKMTYGSDEAIKFAEEVSKVMAIESYKVGIELAKEKGPAPIFNENHILKAEAQVKELFVKSEYMKKMPKEILEEIKIHGCRFTHATSIAPTGTIALSLANNASNGIEPSYLHVYKRNVIEEGKSTKKQVDVYSYEFLMYRKLVNPDATVEDLPPYFVTADTIPPKAHIDMQAVTQKWIDSSISKTINCPSDISFDDFKDLYMYAYQKGCKGVTTYRPSDSVGSVLVNPEEQASKNYTFELDNGETITVPGNEDIEYNGEIHKASLLYEAIKEGQYGKF